MTIIDKDQNKQPVNLPGASAIQQVLAIVGRATTAKRPTLPESRFESRFRAREQQIRENAVFPAVLLCATALPAIWSGYRPLVGTFLVFAIICELAVLTMMILSIIGGAPFLWRLRKAPCNPFLTSVQLSCEHDLPFIGELNGCQEEAVQYVLTQYKQERNGYERRAGTIAGAIDKVGIFPAIAALIITVSNLSKLPGTTAWGGFFGPLLLVFYVLALTSVQMTQRMDRVIALLEFSLQSRK